jgi:hypothetical protein
MATRKRHQIFQTLLTCTCSRGRMARQYTKGYGPVGKDMNFPDSAHLHLQKRTQGPAMSRRAEATSNRISNPPNIPDYAHLHLQQRTQGAAMSRRGEATSNRIPNPANIPITCHNNNLSVFLSTAPTAQKISYELFFKNQRYRKGSHGHQDTYFKALGFFL